MWVLSAGRLSEKICDIVRPNVEVPLTAVDSVLDITNTISTKGLDHFKDVMGIIVLDSGTSSLIDWGWLLQLERLAVPIIYLSRVDNIKPNLNDFFIPHFRFVYCENGIGVKQIAAEIEKEELKRKELAEDWGVLNNGEQ